MLLKKFEPFTNLEKSYYNYLNTNEGVGGFVPTVNIIPN